MSANDDGRMPTNVRMRKSNNGSAVIVYGTCNHVLTVSVVALQKLLDGITEEIQCRKYPVTCELDALDT